MNYELKECTIPKDLNPKQIKSLRLILKKDYKRKKEYIFYKENFEQRMNSITNGLKTFIKENPIASDQEYGLIFSKFIENRSLENDDFLGKIVPFALHIRKVPKQYQPNNFYFHIDTKSFDDVGISLPQKNVTILISKSSTCKELYKNVQKVLKLKETPFYITRLKQNDMKQLYQVQVFNDEIPVSELNSYEFSIHYGLIVHSTKTYIESLIVAQTFKIDDDFIIKTNSKNAKYKVKLPKNRHGMIDVIFDITNDSPTKETDECLILIKLTAEDISNIQEGNPIIHQYRVCDKWINDPQPVFVSYPKCDVIAVYLNHCSDNRVIMDSCKLEDFIPENKRNDTYSRNWEGMNPDTRYYRGRRPYYLPVGYQSFGIKVSNFIENTCVGFHGTSLRAAKSIIENGFLLPSQFHGVLEGHYKLNECIFGINNFADAIFVSPSIKYSSFAYAANIVAQNDDTFVETGNLKLNQILMIILQVRVKPNSFTVNKNTTILNINDRHYSNNELEWRIPNPNDLFPYRLLYIGYEPEEYKRIMNEMSH